MLLNVLFAALSKAMPERMPAAYYACSYVCSFQTQAADGSRKVLVEIEVGGCGAHPLGDGANAQSFGMHNNTAIPMEMIESDVPVTFMGYGLVPGSGGRGQQRGGLGLTRSWRIDADSATFTGQMDRFRFRPFGLAGGEPGGAGRLSLVRDGVVTPLHSKVANMRLRKGDIICLQTSGGGGFGPASARAVAAETEDRLRGYLS